MWCGEDKITLEFISDIYTRAASTRICSCAAGQLGTERRSVCSEMNMKTLCFGAHTQS